MTNCNSCNVSGDRKYKKSQRGGAHTSLSPASLSSSDSIDRAGNSLANTAHKVYVEKNYELAALKNQNVMMGGGDGDKHKIIALSDEDDIIGGGKRKYKTAKKYRSKSKSKQQRGGKDGETMDTIISMYKDIATGGRKRKYKTAKKYRSKSKSKQQRGGKEDDNWLNVYPEYPE